MGDAVMLMCRHCNGMVIMQSYSSLLGFHKWQVLFICTTANIYTIRNVGEDKTFYKVSTM